MSSWWQWRGTLRDWTAHSRDGCPKALAWAVHSPAACVLLWAGLACLACDQPTPGPTLDLPDRPAAALDGAQLAGEVRDLDLDAREERIYEEVSFGNVPSWLRRLERVEVSGEVDGRRHTLEFWVTPDYLAVGSDTASFLVPLSPQAAQRIADLVDASLPTPRMVDAKWASARNRLAPIRIGPNEYITTVRYFERHDRLVQAQRRLIKVLPGEFVAGHKMDVVISAQLAEKRGKVAFYGWHKPDGQPIQPLFINRNDDWVAYNLGIRLVHRRILVDGVARDLLEVLSEPQLAPLLSNEGVIENPRYPTGSHLREPK